MKLGRKFKSQEESSVSFWVALIEIQNSGFLTFCLQPDDLSPNVTEHRFLKNCDIRNRVAVQDVLTNVQKGELTGAVDIYFSTSHKVFSATIN